MTLGDITHLSTIDVTWCHAPIILFVARWEPNTPQRLAQSALDLVAERGYEQTTVEDIAQRAGLTKRTFFRHYADKREVLFGGGDEFQRMFTEPLESAPADAPPLEAVATGLEAVGAMFAGRREFAARRHAVISATPDLRERELVKKASIATAHADGLRARGVTDPEASVTAEVAVAVFRVAFDRWVSGPDETDLATLVRESLGALRAATTAAPA